MRAGHAATHVLAPRSRNCAPRSCAGGATLMRMRAEEGPARSGQRHRRSAGRNAQDHSDDYALALAYGGLSSGKAPPPIIREKGWQ